MPLDPQVKAFLDKAAAIARPKVWDVPPAIARQSFAALMQLTGPKDVAVGKAENFTIPAPGGGGGPSRRDRARLVGDDARRQ